jgi:hypothetical protein
MIANFACSLFQNVFCPKSPFGTVIKHFKKGFRKTKTSFDFTSQKSIKVFPKISFKGLIYFDQNSKVWI